jgi:hypothetical protein
MVLAPSALAGLVNVAQNALVRGKGAFAVGSADPTIVEDRLARPSSAASQRRRRRIVALTSCDA